MLYFPRWKSALIVLVIALGAIVCIPNFFSAETVRSWPSWLPGRHIVLGLDLRGGAHLLLEVEQESLLNDRLETLTGDIRQILRDQRIGYRNLAARGNSVGFTLRDPAQADAAVQALEALEAPIQSGLFGGGSVTEVDVAREGDRITATLTEEGMEARMRGAVSQSLSVLERRVNELGTTEPSIQAQGEDRILVQVPGLEDTTQLKDILGQTARMTFHMECPEGSVTDPTPPIGCEVLQSADPADGPILVESRARLSGDELVDAQPSFSQDTNEPIVTFRFNSRGGAIFGDLTSESIGRRFAVVLDEKVITAPVIRSAILGGSGLIEGNFTVESAQNLAVLLRSGALPADLTIIEERTVGPSLGQDSIEAGQMAALIGLLGVLAFMVLSYGLLGWFSIIALLSNLVLIMAILTLLQATLTLPGIAGIVLTMGMAVDANVLIFERMREEMRAGKSTINSIQSGFSLAIGTIIDANLTTLIAAVALFTLGSGPIRGFAVTLGIGVITTMFTAYTVTRFIVSVWVRWRRPKALPI